MRIYNRSIMKSNIKKFKMLSQEKLPMIEANCWSILKRQAAEFCRETGLHGYRYISQTQRTKMERIVWAIAVLASLCCSFAFIQKIWNFFATHPTLTIIESTHRGIWNYPFPAITVCDINRMSYNLTKIFVENLKTPDNISKEFLVQEMQLLNELIVPGFAGDDVDINTNLTRLQNIIDDNKLSILEVINLITQNCSSFLTICKWKGTPDRCDRYFKQSFSRDGLCCSFNYFTYPDTIPDKMERSSACGFETGMTIMANPEPNDYHSTLIGSYGVKVMIHYSFDYPDFNSEIQLVRLNTQHFVSVNPSEMYSKPEMKNLAVSTRKCIFSEEADDTIYGSVKERNLTYITYTYHNCLAECRASIVKEKCGCIPYYFPQNNSRVCNLKDIACLKKYQSIFDTSWPQLNQDNESLPMTTNDIMKKTPCGCIPDCIMYRYPVESSFGTLDSALYYNNGSFSRNPRNSFNIQNHSIIHVFFNDLVGFQYRRSVNYSWRNLFASFGGLLGLFAGFSLMSIFEFFYFFVIRVITDACINAIRHSNTK